MTAHDIARNAAAVRNLAATLDRWGLDDAHHRAEHIAQQLTADGYRRIEPPPARRGPGASRAAIDTAITHTRAAVAAARAARTDTEGATT